MRIVRCKTAQGINYGIIEGSRIRLLDGDPFADWKVRGFASLEDATLLAPCTPSKIVAVGINYEPHAEEIQFAIPPEPLIFLKPPSAVIGPWDSIVLPDMSQQVEYEGELAVVMGRRAKNISVEDALLAVLGYTCINDVTARDLQKIDVQFTRSKSFDTFAPVGPWIETDVAPGNLQIETRLNGRKKQKANTSSMIRPVEALISFISGVMTLQPGDIIATGTPAGVGILSQGDTVSVTIEKIGTLTNKVEKHDSN